MKLVINLFIRSPRFQSSGMWSHFEWKLANEFNHCLVFTPWRRSHSVPSKWLSVYQCARPTASGGFNRQQHRCENLKFRIRAPCTLYIHVDMEECLCKVIILNKQTTCSAVLLVSICHTHACVDKISLFWMYEMTASISVGTGLPKHAALHINYSTG